MNRRPTTEIPPAGVPLVLFYEADEDEDDLGAKFAIGFHDGSEWHDVNHSGKIDQAWVEGWALIGPAEAPEAQPNTHTVRVAVDVSPLLDGRLDERKHHHLVFDERYAPGQRPGWRRSIGILHAPTPKPLAEIVGVLEAS